MVRMSDLVRGRGKPAAPGPAPSSSEGPGSAERPSPGPPPEAPPARLPPLPARPTPPPVDAPAKPHPRSESRPASQPTSAPADLEAQRAAAESLFTRLVHFLEGVRVQMRREAGTVSWPELERLITTALDSLEGAGELFWVANRPSAPTGVDFVAFHMARVAVLAMRVGSSLGLGRPALIELGMAGCLIDIGLWQLPPTLLKPADTLSADELKLYRTHPRLGADVIRRWAPPVAGLVDLVLQHHEREQGQGYPEGLGGETIQPPAKILGLVDTYTQLTVGPGFKPGLQPHEAIRQMVKTRHDAFPPSLVKALLNEISVFPPGTLVRLNSGEVGRVIGVNRNHPLRPRVEVYDARGQRLAVPKIIDLSEAPFLYITGPVAERAR